MDELERQLFMEHLGNQNTLIELQKETIRTLKAIGNVLVFSMTNEQVAEFSHKIEKGLFS